MQWLAQGLGIVVAVICIISAQLKHRWQMLLCSTVANFLNGLSFFWLGGAWSASALCWVAVFETLLFAYKSYNNKPVTLFEKITFLIIYKRQ